MATHSFHHVGLSVADLDRQCRFYSQAFGFREEYRTEIAEAGTRISLLSGPSGAALELTECAGSAPQHFTDPVDGARTQGYFHWALTVSDLEDALATRSPTEPGLYPRRYRTGEPTPVSPTSPTPKTTS